MKEKKAPGTTRTPSKRARFVSSDFVAKTEKKFITENSEMSKLCNINHDNLEACKDSSRQFLPSLKEFFEEAIDQLDPVNQVEKQYQLIYQTEWAWKALRLLAKKSAFYFMQNQNVKAIPEYLEAIFNKLNKEFINEQLLQQQQEQKQQTLSQSNQDQSSMLRNQVVPGGAGENGVDNDNSQHGNDDETVQLNDEQSNHANNSMAGQNSALTPDSDPDSNKPNENFNEAETEAERQDEIEPMDNDNDTPEIDNVDKVESEFPDVNDIKMNNINESIDMVTNDVQLGKDFFNAELIDLVVEDITDASEWKNMAIKLNMDEDTISFIEDETNDVKQQCKKILQLWKVCDFKY